MPNMTLYFPLLDCGEEEGLNDAGIETCRAGCEELYCQYACAPASCQPLA